jgi:hypothetical protein
MDVTELSGWMQLGLVVLVTAIRYLFERLVARLFKAVKMESVSIQIFAKSIVMVVFNIIVLFLLGLLTIELFAFVNVKKGLIFVAVGLVGAFLVALLTNFAIKAGYGEGYGALLAKSPIEQVLTWVTVLVLVGFVVVFTLYHYANVLSGVEKKEEFLGTLPVRLLVATLLGVSFYATGSLIYGIVIHNMVDTFSYVALMFGARQVEQEKRSA